MIITAKNKKKGHISGQLMINSSLGDRPHPAFLRLRDIEGVTDVFHEDIHASHSGTGSPPRIWGNHIEMAVMGTLGAGRCLGILLVNGC
jgi:hypothetical protein